VLGRLGKGLAGGSIQLDAAKAAEAVRTGVAEKLGMELHEAAEAIVRVANANMADAVRLISISRGYDPRDFALVAFGGAGALHGFALARELSIPVVIVPPNPGVTSALGCLLVDVQHDLSESYIHPAASADPAAIEARFQALEAEAWERMRHEGVQDDHVVMERTIDMMYQGQWRSLAVPVGSPIGPLDAVAKAFHTLHEREYNFRRDGAPVDLYRLNLRAVGMVPKAALAEHASGGVLPAPREHRPVWFGAKPFDTPIYWRPDLPAGVSFSGPAVVEQLDSTTVVPPGARAEVDRYLNIVMRMEG
jgi:N-methylhydantoinase A